MNQIQHSEASNRQVGSPPNSNVASLRYREVIGPQTTKNSQFQLSKNLAQNGNQGAKNVNNITNYTNYHFEMPAQIVISSEDVRSLDRI